MSQNVRGFTTAVFDLVPIQGDYRHELPKTILDITFGRTRPCWSVRSPKEARASISAARIGRRFLRFGEPSD